MDNITIAILVVITLYTLAMGGVVYHYSKKG